MPKKSTKKTSEMLVNVILDKSGSMSSNREGTIEGYNEYLKNLRADKKINYKVTHIQFDAPHNDAELNVLYNQAPLSEVKDLTAAEYEPRGLTPLYDAIGECVRRVGDYSGGVITVVITDGLENASKEFKQEDIKALIAEKEKEGWKFVFLGADIDSYAVGGSLGVSVAATSNYQKGMEKNMFANLARSTASYAMCASTQGLDTANRAEFFSPEQKIHMGDSDAPFLPTNSGYMTIGEFAKKLNVTRRTAYSWAQSGEIPAKKIGRVWRVKESDLP